MFRQKSLYASNYKKKAKKPVPENTEEGKRTLKLEQDLTQSKENAAKLRERRKLVRIQEMYRKLFESLEEITVNDIPYEGMEPPEILDIMLQVKFFIFCSRYVHCKCYLLSASEEVFANLTHLKKKTHYIKL